MEQGERSGSTTLLYQLEAAAARPFTRIPGTGLLFLLETLPQTAAHYIAHPSSCFQGEGLSQHEISPRIEGSCRSLWHPVKLKNDSPQSS